MRRGEGLCSREEEQGSCIGEGYPWSPNPSPNFSWMIHDPDNAAAAARDLRALVPAVPAVLREGRPRKALAAF